MENRPPRPEDVKCKCGTPIAPVFIEPVYYTLCGVSKCFTGSNRWESAEFCPECVEKNAAEVERQNILRIERSREIEMRELFARSGLMPKEMEMLSRPWEGSAARSESINSWWKGEGKSLYIHGTPGNGKTHAAVQALAEFIRNERKPGQFFVVADLIRKLRMAVKTHDDDAMVEFVTHAPALVLDDIAVERPTGFVLEAMQSIVDTRYRNLDKLTIITSNLSLNDLAERLDDRIASRLISMCEVVEFTAKDRRLIK